MIKDAKGSQQADVYSFGILLWELATREEVYAGLSAAQIIAKVANEGLRPKAPRGTFSVRLSVCLSFSSVHSLTRTLRSVPWKAGLEMETQNLLFVWPFASYDIKPYR